MTSGDRIRLWPIVTTAALVLLALITVVVLRGSFFALLALALVPVGVATLWILMRGQWLRAQVDALPRYLTSRRVHVVVGEANDMQAVLARLRRDWGWQWTKHEAFERNMANLEPHVARARATGLYGLRTRRPERVPKGRLQDTHRVHRELRRHLILSLAQELEIREQSHAGALAALREQGLCTFDAGTGLSKEPRWIDVNARIDRIRDEELLAIKEAVASLQGGSPDVQEIRRVAEEAQRQGDPRKAIEALRRLRPRQDALHAASPHASGAPPTGPTSMPRKKGDVL